MKKIFPYYKDKCIAKNPLGYTNVANAKKRMDLKPILADFDLLFDDEYWFNKTYVLKTVDSRHNNMCGLFCHEINLHKDVLYKEPIYIKDLTGDIRTLLEEYYHLYYIHFTKITKEENERGFEIVKQLNDLYYYVFLYRDKEDYNKKLKQYIKDNVQFIEKEVEINVK